MRKLFIVAAIIGAVAFTSTYADASALRSVGFGAGYVSPDNVDGTWTAGVNFDFELPVTNLYVSPFAGYWNWSEEVTVFGITSETSLRDFYLGGNAKYVFPLSNGKLHPYVQGGLAVHMLSASIDVLGFSVSATETKIGLTGGGGLLYDVGERWGLFGQGSFHVVSDINQWMIGAGAQFRL